jgi:3,4-dihydroxyphenylacetate 2,3-dioxygenase
LGEIVAAAVCGHVPTIMLREDQRLRMGNGHDTTLVAGLDRLREKLDERNPDTFVIIDTHWFTTTEHIVAGAEHHSGCYTSDELPRVISDLAYDFAGAPELGRRVEEVARERKVWAINSTNPNTAQHYPTLNLLHYLHRGERVLSAGICQTGEREDFLEFGETIGEAIRRSDARVAILASGGMSHRFWPLKAIRKHQQYGPEHIISAEARAFDERILDLWSKGDHAAVIDLYPEYEAHSPEGLFGHYLTLVGAVGGRDCKAPGEQLSDYENSVGTGQVHVWFDLPT